MKIIVLHGNDTEKSYARLTKFIDEAKKRQWQVTDYSLQEVENQSLFDENKFYILYDYKLLDKNTAEKLKKYAGNLVVYHNAKIPAPTLKNLNADKVELFELPQMLWKFLDNITVKGLHEITETQPIEYIFAMIGWKLKQNYISKAWPASLVKDPTEKNANLITELAKIDVKSKTTDAKLSVLLDYFIAKHLQ
ncbi:MAG: hypothetical protein AAB778_00235 [Patescibacteria group bacterium]